MTHFLRIAFCCLLAGIACCAGAEDLVAIKPVRDYFIHYNVFASDFLQPEIAADYHLTRGDDIAVVNIALTQQQGAHETLGLPAEITGTVTSLVGQQQVLQFQAINENGVYYYLAQFRHTHLDRVVFDITLLPQTAADQPPATPLKLQFSRTLWVKGRS